MSAYLVGGPSEPLRLSTVAFEVHINVLYIVEKRFPQLRLSIRPAETLRVLFRPNSRPQPTPSRIFILMDWVGLMQITLQHPITFDQPPIITRAGKKFITTTS